MSLLGSAFFPIVGVILSNALYFSSVPAVYNAYQTSHLAPLNVLPLAIMVLSCIGWMSYALAVPNIYIMLSNLPGTVVAVGYVMVTLPLIPNHDRSSRVQVQMTLVVGSALLLCLWSALVFGGATHSQTTFILGAYGSFICVIMFASPLSTMGEVIRTGNAASIYAPLTATQVSNCLMWTCYGLAIGDVWVYGPNGTGLALGLVQLALKLSYPSVPGEAAREHAHLKDSCSDSDAERP
jgi:solute carrier family 50 (sugar transporter)